MNTKQIEILEKIRSSLIFASKENFLNLKMIRGLQPMVLSLLKQVRDLQLAGGAREQRRCEMLSRMEEMFAGFNTLEIQGKKDAIREGLSLIEKLVGKGDHPEIQTLKKTSGHGFRDKEIALRKLASPISELKGVGPRLSELFEKKGMETIEDLFFFLPRAYMDRRSITKIPETVPGKMAVILGWISEARLKYYGRRKVFEVIVADGTGVLTVKWFKGNELYLRNTFKPGKRIILTGEVRQWHAVKEMIHPEFEFLDDGDLAVQGGENDESLHFGRIVPIYSETEGLHQKTIRRIVKQALDKYLPHITDPIPEQIRNRYLLGELKESIREVHFPGSSRVLLSSGATTWDPLKTLKFNEFFFFELGMAFRRKGYLRERGISFRKGNELVDSFHAALPFQLTSAQSRVISEVICDMEKDYPMNRLIQGDVGCGKTVVAMTAMLKACGNGYQCVLMAPTEILAEQHFEQVRHWAKDLGLNLVLLTGSLGRKSHDMACERISGGEARIVIGTHAVVQEKIAFHSLGLVVIDEQHRFGVLQRTALREKGLQPDILFMTATPIPRTLAMTVYGDLDVSVIDELPPQKKKVSTRVVLERDRALVYEDVRRELARKNQAFIVYPLAEESEVLDLKDAVRMAEHLQKNIFPEYRIGLIHGRMKGVEKDRIMKAFAAGQMNALVATTVIEVGIDIPGASLIVIEHAERFGLSQLHQLRGRVGRNDIPCSCILLASGSRSEISSRRLRIMEETNDGFRIAEEDLEIRGPGEILGTRQSGLPEFKIADIVRDGRILNEARYEAFAIIEQDPELAAPEHALLKEVLATRWGGKLRFLGAG